MAKQERNGAAHRITRWRPITPGDQTGPRGTTVSRRREGEGNYTHDLAVTQGSRGYTADIDYTSYVGHEGVYSDQFSAGPFKTQRRAEIAGGALYDRAEADTADEYKTGSDFTSAEELQNG